MGSAPSDIVNLGAAHFNVLMYPETGESACRFLEKSLDQPFTKTVPIGVGALSDFIKEVEGITGLNDLQNKVVSRLPWYSASVDSTYLTGKGVFIFGDGSHVISAARIAQEDFEFSDANGPSHHAAHQPAAAPKDIEAEEALSKGSSSNVIWMTDAEKELRKIPFFVRGKAKRNTERYAADNGVLEISIDTLYEAKAHYAR